MSATMAAGSTDVMSTSGTQAQVALQNVSVTGNAAAGTLGRVATSGGGGGAPAGGGGGGGGAGWLGGAFNTVMGLYTGNYMQAAQGMLSLYSGYQASTATTQAKTTTSAPAAAPDETGDMYQYAKGGTFGVGALHRFAKGGAFTNRIVDQPTLIRFANGGQFSHGEIGEAGPEAVMPLQRDSQGRLGVIAQQTGGSKESAPPPPPQNNIRIVNAFDSSVISDYMGSSAGEQVIMNAVKRNPSVIKKMAKA